MQGDTAEYGPARAQKIKLESGIRKYQLTIPLPKSIKTVVNTTLELVMTSDQR